MPKNAAVPNPKISDESVKARTGRDWESWFKLLDAEGAAELDHKAIVALLTKQYQVGPWWRQMVANTYEKSRGLRADYETQHGAYQISRSRTVQAPASRVYQAWHAAPSREAWLGKTKFEVRSAKQNVQLRLAWKRPASRVEISFVPKPQGKTQVVVQHTHLADAEAAETMKDFWTGALDRLQTWLASP